jgi:hypothetical protein
LKKDANKAALSRALGAAFLSHQVEQLEKSVGNASGNWRDRRFQIHHQAGLRDPGYHARGPTHTSPKRSNTLTANTGTTDQKEHKDKVADVIVVDASVLVHALNQLKLWSRPERKEVVIVPLEGVYQRHVVWPILTESQPSILLIS